MKNKLSPVQQGVNLLQNLAQLGVDPATYVTMQAELHNAMHAFAVGEIGYSPVDNSEDESYWAATSLFFRKVYQAAAAAA